MSTHETDPLLSDLRSRLSDATGRAERRARQIEAAWDALREAGIRAPELHDGVERLAQQRDTYQAEAAALAEVARAGGELEAVIALRAQLADRDVLAERLTITVESLHSRVRGLETTNERLEGIIDELEWSIRGTVAGTCARKRRHATRQEAEAVLATVAAKGRSASLSVYECPVAFPSRDGGQVTPHFHLGRRRGRQN